jgi:GTP 3',8-cyclase
MLRDTFGRELRDLRISVTDRCNFGCVYCRATDSPGYLPPTGLLSWEQLLRVAQAFVRLGTRKIRLTGGEPLLRPGLVEFVARLRNFEGLEDLALTTNGTLLAGKARSLAAAGLCRVNISVDSIRPERFASLTQNAVSLPAVLAGVEAAQEAGLLPVKLNVVLVRGFNDVDILDLVDFARQRQLIIRFIEFMPFNGDDGWSPARVVTAREIIETIHPVWPLAEIPASIPYGTARRYRFADGGGEMGIIAPVSLPFCRACSRMRLTADGKIRTCLYSREEHDIRVLLSNSDGDQELARSLMNIVRQKEPRHHINESDFVPPARTMMSIGG